VSLLADEGRSADFLQETLNLLPHSLRAAISYLRRAGVGIESARRNGQTIYRLAQGAAQVADTLFNGIDESIRNFYSNRAAALA
jgi:biotin operon repressor